VGGSSTTGASAKRPRSEYGQAAIIAAQQAVLERQTSLLAKAEARAAEQNKSHQETVTKLNSVLDKLLERLDQGKGAGEGGK